MMTLRSPDSVLGTAFLKIKMVQFGRIWCSTGLGMWSKGGVEEDSKVSGLGDWEAGDDVSEQRDHKRSRFE